MSKIPKNTQNACCELVFLQLQFKVVQEKRCKLFMNTKAENFSTKFSTKSQNSLYIEKIHRHIHKIQRWIVILMVEPRGIEPLSESNLERLSPGAVCYLHSLIPSGTNTLTASVASLCMVRSTLCARTVSTQITPEPGSWTFRGGWAPN